MKIGFNGAGAVRHADIGRIAADAQAAVRAGLSSYWLADHPTGGFDALTALAVAGQDVTDIELGTAIVPTYPRNPMALAAQVLTVSDALDGRFTLGIGLSHATMMADLGIEFAKPIRHLREYLSILMPLLTTGEVSFNGELLACEGRVFKRPSAPVPVLVAALGPQALRVTGRLADGTTLAWVGTRTVREHIVPTISEAAAAAGRAAPRVLASLPLCVTDEPDKVRASIDANLGSYAQLPSYSAMFEREGVDSPSGVAMVGSRQAVEDQIEAMRAAGATDFAPTVYGLTAQEREASLALLTELAGNAA